MTAASGVRAPRFSRRRLAVAFAVAAASDALSVALVFNPPLQWAVDGATAAALFLVLGRQWVLLPGLVMEAVPGLYVLPFWVLVVGAVAAWGTARPTLRRGPFKPPDGPEQEYTADGTRSPGGEP